MVNNTISPKGDHRIVLNQPSIFILDVDGVMTDGALYYTEAGKIMKRFGPDDHDALNLIRKYIPVRFISGDSRGFAITAKRIREDMGYPLDLVGTVQRRLWIAERYPLDTVIYMGDGIFDALVLRHVGYGIAPANGSFLAKSAADFVTEAAGGDRAVAEACIHLLDRFFEPLMLEDLLTEKAGDQAHEKH